MRVTHAIVFAALGPPATGVTCVAAPGNLARLSPAVLAPPADQCLSRPRLGPGGGAARQTAHVMPDHPNYGTDRARRDAMVG